MSLLTFGIPSWLVYLLAIGVVLGGFYAKGRLDQKHANEIATLEATIADVRAKLEANDEIRRKAEADAARSEAEEQKLKELIDALQNDKSCPLTRDHVDGVRRIDAAP